MRPSRPILDLLLADVSKQEAERILELVHTRKVGAPLASALRNVRISEQLRHDLWELANGFSVNVQPVSDAAAAEIFREILRDYQGFNELGERERKGAVQDFILSVESQVRAAITIPFDEFEDAVLRADKPSTSMKQQILTCGRYFASSGIWPARGEVFNIDLRKTGKK